MPITAHMATAGCLARAFSTSAEYTFSAPVTIMSLTRSTMKVKPSSSMYAASPVCSQPLRTALAVSSGLFQ
ncbi:hypothetical protein D9M71_849760 [compost metagenome]